MKFTGNETFPIKRGNRLVQKRLSDFTDFELLFMANTFQQENDRDPARALLTYLNARRQQAAGIKPGPQAA